MPCPLRFFWACCFDDILPEVNIFRSNVLNLFIFFIMFIVLSYYYFANIIINISNQISTHFLAIVRYMKGIKAFWGTNIKFGKIDNHIDVEFNAVAKNQK
jgi:hypothetical protein